MCIRDSLPGDPLRARFIAENFLEDAVCFNEVRNMFGYTGTYKGHRVSVMGTGMGMPSISIYARELIVDYGVKKLIRVGTAGSLNEDVHVRELVLAQAAATNSNIIRNDWPQYDFPQIASFDLLDKAYHIAKDLGMTTHVGLSLIHISVSVQGQLLIILWLNWVVASKKKACRSQLSQRRV